MPTSGMASPNRSAVLGSGTAENVPATLLEKLSSVSDTTDAAGLTSVNPNEIALGVPRLVITSEVNVIAAPDAVLPVRVRPVPEPKTLSVKVPDRKFVPVPPEPLVIEKLPE